MHADNEKSGSGKTESEPRIVGIAGHVSIVRRTIDVVKRLELGPKFYFEFPFAAIEAIEYRDKGRKRGRHPGTLCDKSAQVAREACSHCIQM